MMDEADEGPDVMSVLPDLRDVSLRTLAERTTTRTDKALERVLDLEANGLLTVSSFNASI
jgi:hypothetical protein